MSEQSKVLIEVENLRKYFSIKAGAFRRKYVQAVESVTFSIYRGETLGLVGESGCGKTTLGRTIIRLHEPTSGRIVYDGTPIYASEKHIAADMLPFRRKMQIIFQDPSASLDPRMTVGEIVGEALDIHGLCTGKQERRDRINELLDVVGLNTEHANRFPHEFSGGQQQRVGIDRALAVEPEFIVCDEPISALDVSIQSQVVNMLEDLQADKNLTYLFIAHDISVVRHIWRRATSCAVTRCTLTRRRCFRPCRCRIPSRAGPTSASFWRETSPARSIRLPDAASIRAARTPRTAAAPNSRSSRSRARGTSPPAICWTADPFGIQLPRGV